MNPNPVSLAPFAGVFQLAYVTTDYERAMALFAETHGIQRFFEARDLRYATKEGREAHCNIALAYVGATEIEVIQPIDGDVQFYRDFLPDSGFAVRFHHFCKLFDTDAAYEQQIREYEARGMHFTVNAEMPQARYFYCDFRAELGHYIEGVIFSKEARENFLPAIPRF